MEEQENATPGFAHIAHQAWSGPYRPLHSLRQTYQAGFIPISAQFEDSKNTETSSSSGLHQLTCNGSERVMSRVTLQSERL